MPEQMTLVDQQAANDSSNADPVEQFKWLWATASEKQRREIYEIVNSPAENWTRTPCAHQAILDLYHKTLPMLNPVRIYTPARRGHVKARWQDMPNLEEWSAYFRLVARCPHLIGRGDPWNGRTWKADFDWLINPTNFTKVIEGKYGE